MSQAVVPVDGLPGVGVVERPRHLVGDRSVVDVMGDVDADGKEDILVAAKSFHVPSGSSRIYYAGAAYLVLTSSFDFGATVAAGTNYDITTAIRFDGEAQQDYAGTIAGLGDVEGDGLPDLMIGAESHDPSSGSSAGAAYLILSSGSYMMTGGSLSGADVTFEGANAGDDAGASVSAAGDVDGDGYGDFLIGAPGNNGATTTYQGGAAYLIYGGTKLASSAPFTAPLPGPACTTFGREAASILDEIGDVGNTVGAAGDLNADGYADFFLGAPEVGYPSHLGTLHVVFGKPGLRGFRVINTIVP